MQIVRRSSFVATPWKNGGGITHEALRVPSTGATFRWRVSVARIDASGPFSDFAQYNRKMVLLEGAGVRLTLGGARTLELRKRGDFVEFDGAERSGCELLNGPCTDLNLMIAKSLASARVWVQEVTEPCAVASSGAETLLVFPISGVLSINGAAELAQWDLGVVYSGESRRFAPSDGGPPPLVFFATLDDNSH